MEEKNQAADSRKSSVSLTDGLGKPKQLKASIQTFLELIEDAYGDRLRLNDLNRKPEWYDATSGEWKEWTDVQDCQMRAYFQSAFGLYNVSMLSDASDIYFASRRINPVVEMLERLKWDGKTRIERFLTEVAKADDTEYNAEASRLIFAGGIHRAYRPGCKFDDMVVLIGAQGGGKSTIVRWLNMDDKFFREIKSISGKEGMEQLRGVWIGEVAELMAMTRVKESEAVKAFITSQEDSYRPPYGKHVETYPRRCSFIGTTNNPQFLSDKTGNRRFYPVKCHEDGYRLRDREKEVREFIRQCWAEAVTRFKNHDLQPYARENLLSAIRDAQEDATEDDWRIGAIRQYLDEAKTRPEDMVCVIELWHNALNEPPDSKPSRKDSIEISYIMNDMKGWHRHDKAKKLPKWGVQKVYVKDQDFFPFWR